jgi:hypothetical protein
VPHLDAAPHERPRDQKAAVAVRGILLGTGKADAEARDAIEQPLDAALVELLRLNAVVVDLAVRVVALARLWPAAERSSALRDSSARGPRSSG